MTTSGIGGIGADDLAATRTDLHFLVARVHRALRRRWEEELAGSNVTGAQSEVLFLVGAEPGISQQQLAERLVPTR